VNMDMDSPTIVTIVHEYDKRFNTEYWLVVSVTQQTGSMRYICINDLGHIVSRFTLSPSRFMYKRTLRTLLSPASWNVLRYPSVESVLFCRRAVLTEYEPNI